MVGRKMNGLRRSQSGEGCAAVQGVVPAQPSGDYRASGQSVNSETAILAPSDHSLLQLCYYFWMIAVGWFILFF